jgi:hypothetical protein
MLDLLLLLAALYDSDGHRHCYVHDLWHEDPNDLQHTEWIRCDVWQTSSDEYLMELDTATR